METFKQKQFFTFILSLFFFPKGLRMNNASQQSSLLKKEEWICTFMGQEGSTSGNVTQMKLRCLCFTSDVGHSLMTPKLFHLFLCWSCPLLTQAVQK